MCSSISQSFLPTEYSRPQILQQPTANNNPLVSEEPHSLENLPITEDTPSTTRYSDQFKVEEALGGTQDSNVTAFQEKFGVSIATLVRATLSQLTEIRQSNVYVSYGGFKGFGLKGWKFVVKLDAQKNIEEIFIGIFLTAGGFTKVYLTGNQKVICVPKKGERSIRQTQNAYRNICYVHSRCEKLEESSKTLADLLQHLHLTSHDLLLLLPPLPKMFSIATRPILVAPKAHSALDRFKKAPATLRDLIERIEIMIHAVIVMTYFHEAGLVHGDIKPDNILIDAEGRGIIHDLGGSKVFSSEDNSKDALNKYVNLSTTPTYNHYRDVEAYNLFYKNKADVCEVYKLGCARDAFALGVTTLESLMGMYDSEGTVRLPFYLKDYKKVEIPQKVKTHQKIQTVYYVNRIDSALKKIPCMKKLPKDIVNRFQKLLEQILQPEYTERLTASKYALELNHIYSALSKWEQQVN